MKVYAHQVEKVRDAAYRLLSKGEQITNVTLAATLGGRWTPEGVGAVRRASDLNQLRMFKEQDARAEDGSLPKKERDEARQKAEDLKHVFVHDWKKGTQVNTADPDAELLADKQHAKKKINMDVRELNRKIATISTSGSTEARERTRMELEQSLNQRVGMYNLIFSEIVTLTPVADEFGKLTEWKVTF